MVLKKTFISRSLPHKASKPQNKVKYCERNGLVFFFLLVLSPFYLERLARHVKHTIRGLFFEHTTLYSYSQAKWHEINWLFPRPLFHPGQSSRPGHVIIKKKRKKIASTQDGARNQRTASNITRVVFLWPNAPLCELYCCHFNSSRAFCKPLLVPKSCQDTSLLLQCSPSRPLIPPSRAMRAR